jgi:predicted Zn finger-like uncharacterized protein
MPDAMTVQCPHCQTRYLLPDHLLGPRGARVRCPGCGQRFDVARGPEGSDLVATATAETLTSEAATAEPVGNDDEATQVARTVLRGLAERLGERLSTARTSGRVLAEFGPELMSAWDAYREQLGDGAPARPFRSELRTTWGVDLITGVE